MNFSLESLKSLRAFALQLTEGLSDEALNLIPDGFNNNIIWNLAHLVAAEQGVIYVRSGLPPTISADFVKTYTRGTKPESRVDAEGIARIKSMLSSTIPALEEDFARNAFIAYKPWTTPYGITISTIDEALQFLLFHEGLHCGYIMALKRVLNNI